MLHTVPLKCDVNPLHHHEGEAVLSMSFISVIVTSSVHNIQAFKT